MRAKQQVEATAEIRLWRIRTYAELVEEFILSLSKNLS
jgi:hypothetical protein